MKTQQGVALITILVMVALATILAATIAKRQAHTTEGTAYLMRQNQSVLYAQSAEAFFAELLKDDAETAGELDHLNETWAQPMPAFPVEDGYVSGQLQDESGKFNLNSLVKPDGTVNESAKQLFERLLQRLNLPAQLSEAVIDWQDPDDLVLGAMGAESNYYQGQRPAYIPANTLFHSTEELKLVRGFEGENFQRIAPFVTASPKPDSPININTAAAVLLASLSESLQVNQIELLLQQRKMQGQYFENLDDLWALEGFQTVPTEQRAAIATLLGVESHYFQAQIEVMLSERKRQITSMLWRNEGQVHLVQRSMTPF